MTQMHKFADEASAKADPIVGAYWADDQGGGSWRGDVCIPNVQVWNPAQDTTASDGTVTHTFQTGFFIRIAGPALNTTALYALPSGWMAQPDFAES
jgi:hypothetical protein